MASWLKTMASWLKRKNWLHETKVQELTRRLRAVESSLQSAHERINEQDQRISGLALLFGQKTVHPENLSGGSYGMSVDDDLRHHSRVQRSEHDTPGR